MQDWLFRRRQQAGADLDPNAPLKLKKPFRPSRPSQIPRLRLRPRPFPAPERQRRGLPAPLRLPLLHAVLSFIFLAILPPRPLSIPTALGLAAAIIFYIIAAANYSGYHLDDRS